MMWLFFLSCQEVDHELVSIKERARLGDWEHVEKQYREQIHKKPDRALYHALASVLDAQEKPEEAHATRMRAQSMSDLSLWNAGFLVFVGLGLWAWCRSRWSWFFVGCGLVMLAFYEDLRYKGTVLSAQTNVFHTLSNRGIPLFSLEKGSVVGIIEEDSGYFLIEYEQKRGWVEQKRVLSWNPSHSLYREDSE